MGYKQTNKNFLENILDIVKNGFKLEFLDDPPLS